MMATVSSKTSNAPSVEHYINYKSKRGKSKTRHAKFQKLRPWAQKCIEDFSVPYVDPQFVSDYRRFIFLNDVLGRSATALLACHKGDANASH